MNKLINTTITLATLMLALSNCTLPIGSQPEQHYMSEQDMRQWQANNTYTRSTAYLYRELPIIDTITIKAESNLYCHWIEIKAYDWDMDKQASLYPSQLNIEEDKPGILKLNDSTLVINKPAIESTIPQYYEINAITIYKQYLK